MKTTIELPDELFRQAKAHAALEGVRLKDLVEQGLRLALQGMKTKSRTRIKLPVHRSSHPGALKAQTVARAEEASIRDEDAGYGRLGRR